VKHVFLQTLIVISLSVLVIIVLSNHLAYGNTCPKVSDQDAFNNSPLIFSGLVTNKTRFPDNNSEVIVHLHINEVFKGDYIPDTITFDMQECGTQLMKSCEVFEFEQGKQYVVYTVGYPHVFVVDPFCTHTQLLTAYTLDQTRQLSLMNNLTFIFEIIAGLTGLVLGFYVYRKRKRN
jgi:hypothetical protein